MAAQGRLDIAAKYARFQDLSCAVLKDRIFHAAPIPGYQPPPFPFEAVQVHVHIPQQQQQVVQQQQHQHQAQQGYAKQPGYNAPNRGQFAVQAPTPVAVGYTAQTPGYQPQQPRVPSPGYHGRQPQPGYNQQPTAYPTPVQQQPSYGAPQQGYNAQVPAQPTYPQQQAFNVPQQAGYVGQTPGAFNRPQQPGFSGPPSNSGYNMPQPQQPGVFHANPAAVPQGTGVNSLAAATSLGSSRISKPSVNMQEQKKDGFVSSVGNSTLAKKYGNDTTGAPSPSASAPAKSFNDVPLGSTESVGAQDLVIVSTFNDLVAQLQTLPLTMVRALYDDDGRSPRERPTDRRTLC